MRHQGPHSSTASTIARRGWPVRYFKLLVRGMVECVGEFRAVLNRRPGLVAANSALLGQWLLRKALPGAPFAPYSLANRVVRVLPGDFATRSIDLLGHRALDLTAGASLVAALALAFGIGRHRAAFFGISAFGLTVLAAAVDPVHPAVFPSTMSATVAALAAFGAVAMVSQQPGGTVRATVIPSRRRFIAGALMAAGLGGLGTAAAWRALAASGSPGPVRADRTLDVPGDPAFDAVPGLAPRITPTADHYVVDINLDDPFLSASSWRLKVSGAVRSPGALSLADLRAMATSEQPILLQCISNPVAGGLIGNARWTGARLADVLELAGLTSAATALIVRAADDYSETVPIEIARGEDAFLVFGMNGRLLPVAHGYPARLILPGRYGMRSVKWVTSIEATGDRTEGYWEKRGWDREAIMRTGARFDSPRNGATVGSRLTAAGLAYAGERGVQRVEVSSDDAKTWRAVTLEPAPGPFAWRRWMVNLDLEPGVHALQVRATDGTGAIQSPDRMPPHPAGASGYHRVVVTSA